MSSPSADLAVLARSAKEPGHIPPPRSRWKTRILLPGAIALVFLGLVAWAARGSLLPAHPVRVIPVVVKTMAQPDGTAAFQAPGWIEPDPYVTYVSALADGVVKEVLVLEGESVQAGQEIVRMVDEDAKLSLERAEAELRTAQASHQAALREWDHPTERQRMVAVAEARRAEINGELKRLEAEVAVETARVDELEEQLGRQEKAGVGDAIPEYEVVRTRLQLKTQKAVLAAARAREPVLRAKHQEAEAEVSAARENLRLRIPEHRALEGSAAELARAQTARDEAALRLSRMLIKAPVDGIVLRRLVEPGAKLMLGGDMSRSAQAVSLYTPSRLQVRVDVPLADAAHVSVGQKARVTVEVLPDSTFEAEVTRITHEADLQKNTLQVKVRLAQPTPELKPEMLARVQFMSVSQKGNTASEKARVFAPERVLIRRGNEGWQAWVADSNRGVAMLRDVTAGPARLEGWVEITQGLSPGDRLIANPPAGLEDGGRIHVVGEDAN